MKQIVGRIGRGAFSGRPESAGGGGARGRRRGRRKGDSGGLGGVCGVHGEADVVLQRVEVVGVRVGLQSELDESLFAVAEEEGSVLLITGPVAQSGTGRSDRDPHCRCAVVLRLI